MFRYFFFLMAISTAFSQPQEIHCKHFFKGYPLGTPTTNDLIIRDTYALSNNDSTKFADWVAYRLTMHEVDGTLDLFRKWRSDPWLDETETLEPSSPDDYKKAHDSLETDRGHQAPLASFKGSRYASQVNYLSNITPQKSNLNQGPWKDLEEQVRDVVRTGRTVYVMTGTLYETDMGILPFADEDHVIPSGYWKIITVLESDDLFNTASFIFNQDTPRNDLVIDHLTTIDEIETRSGLDFFRELDNPEEAALQSGTHQQFASQFFN